jgi:hypothetical protein
MHTITSISHLPSSPAVYALYGGRGRSAYVAYVGIAGHLRSRIEQHLVRRDSSVATGVAAAALNPDLVTEVRWWEHPAFADRGHREAAELVAFDVLEPTLRSRGGVGEAARALHADATFNTAMHQLFTGDPTGQLVIPSLQDALDRLEQLEARVRVLEARVGSREVIHDD